MSVMGLREVLSSLAQGVAAEPSFSLGKSCSPETQQELWSKYTAYRKAGFVKPFHVRRTPYRIKVFHMASHIVKEYTGARHKVEKELAILQQLNHESITSYAFIADERSRISIVMDWAGESLREHREQHPELYTEAAVRHMAYQLTSALLHCHQQGIIHRDVKRDNIGVQRDMQVHLFDWGEAVTLSDVTDLGERELAQEVAVAGTPLFMPPESLAYLTSEAGEGRGALRDTLTTKLDIWGLGTVLYFLLAGRDMFQEGDGWELEDLAELAGSSEEVELPEGVAASCAARDFLRCCLHKDPEHRWSAKELLQHPWLCGATSLAELELARSAAASRRGAAHVAVVADDTNCSSWSDSDREQQEGGCEEQAVAMGHGGDCTSSYVDCSSSGQEVEDNLYLNHPHHHLAAFQGQQHALGRPGASWTTAAAAGGVGVLGSYAGLKLARVGVPVGVPVVGKASFEEPVCEVRLRPSASAASLGA